MKNYNGYFIIAGAIVIASAIISLTIYMQNTSSLDHCYKKVYKSQLKREIRHYNNQSKSRVEKGLTPLENILSTAEEMAALNSREACKR